MKNTSSKHKHSNEIREGTGIINTYPEQSKRLSRVAASFSIKSCPQLGSLVNEDVPINSPTAQYFQTITVQTSNLCRKTYKDETSLRVEEYQSSNIEIRTCWFCVRLGSFCLA
jgi:hypothetical protein